MYGTCETLCRELAAKYPGDAPLMLVIWSPEEIQALADGMEISLTDHEIRTVLARMEDIPEDQRTESGISSAAVMEIISNVSENRQVTPTAATANWWTHCFPSKSKNRVRHPGIS